MLTSCWGTNEREDCFRVSVQRRLFRLNDQDNYYFQTRMIQSRLYKIRGKKQHREREKRSLSHLHHLTPGFTARLSTVCNNVHECFMGHCFNGLLLFMITHIFLTTKARFISLSHFLSILIRMY